MVAHGLASAVAGDAIELHGSRIVVGTGLLDECGSELRLATALQGRRFVIIADDIVAPLYAAQLRAACATAASPEATVLTVAPGEGSKTRQQWARLTDEMLGAGFGRDTAVIALGGGVVGDLAGFVAATYMRGVPFVQVPTTLLAMIDASVGGKTGVDTAAGKNLVGAFHHAAVVISDPDTLRTLPAAQVRNGLAEAIKHGVIDSASEFEWLATNMALLVRPGGPGGDVAARLVRRHVALKAGIVARDERELGVRKVLNFGHTVGHAVEAQSEYTLLHGECVAIGMVAEARIAARIGICDADLADLIAQLLADAGLPVHLPDSMDAELVVAATRSDKKARAGRVEYVLPARLGQMAGAEHGYGFPVDDEIVLRALVDR